MPRRSHGRRPAAGRGREGHCGPAAPPPPSPQPRPPAVLPPPWGLRDCLCGGSCTAGTSGVAARLAAQPPAGGPAMGPVTRPCGPCTLLGRVRGLPEPPRASCLGGGRTHPWWRGVNLLQLRRAESSGSWDLEWKRWILGLSMPLPPLLGDRSPCSSPHLPSPPLEAQPELLPACVPQSAGHPCPQLPPLADHLQAQPWPAGAWQGPQQARDGGANGWRSPPLLPGIGGPRGPGGDSGPGHTASGSQGPRAMEVALALSTPVTRIRARSRVGAAQKGVPGDRTQDSHQGCRGPVLDPPSGLPECFTSSRGGSKPRAWCGSGDRCSAERPLSPST